ncbi:hypothetical protein CCP3SC5AM1_750014 [Gammaproteobacteria bacterium]
MTWLKEKITNGYKIIINLSMLLLLMIPVLVAMALDQSSVIRIPPEEKRVALVIGNNNYIHVDKLNNAAADAEAMKNELTSLGFEVVYRQNSNRKDMNKAIDIFIEKLSVNAVGMIFYAGHGVQIRNVNYLLPVDIAAEEENDVVNDSIDLFKVLERMSETQAKFSLVILDDCRNNPFKKNFSGVVSRNIGSTRGLATISSNASGIMVVYSAGVNQMALDQLSPADKNPHGLFTREFLKEIKKPGIKIQDLITEVKQKVITLAKSVGHIQTPAIYDQSVGTFFFLLPENTKIILTAEQNGNGAKEDRESIFWQSTKDDPESCQDYLRNWPKGIYAVLAKRCMNKKKNIITSPNVAKSYPVQDFSFVTNNNTPGINFLVNLRTDPKILSIDEVKAMIMDKNFFDSDENKKGHFDNNLKDNGDGSITDYASGLMWQKGGSENYMNYGKSVKYIQELNFKRFAGYEDWRLPTLEEGASLLESEERNGDLYVDPLFDKTQRWIWTFDKKESFAVGWSVRFDRGSIDWSGNAGVGYVRGCRTARQ